MVEDRWSAAYFAGNRISATHTDNSSRLDPSPIIACDGSLPSAPGRAWKGLTEAVDSVQGVYRKPEEWETKKI
jgi:hypothetical protein